MSVRQDLPTLIGGLHPDPRMVRRVVSEYYTLTWRSRKWKGTWQFHSDLKKARCVTEDLCTGCGICQEKCPKKVIDEIYEAGLGFRKAVYTPFPQAVPKFPVIDKANCTFFQKGTCKACEKFCPTGAIDFDQEDEFLTFQVGNIVLATGYDLFDPRKVSQYGYGRLANVFTSLEFERLTNAADRPTAISSCEMESPPRPPWASSTAWAAAIVTSTTTVR
jgi:heterodisulfide reductase subunit A-like polyferredoxin